MLTTGTADFSTTENTDSSFSVDTGTGSYEPLVDLAENNGLSTNQYNSNVLSFEFTLADATLNAISGKFAFATDEFPDQSITDILGIFVNGTNVAFFPDGDLVNFQPDDSDFFNSGYAFEWDGVTDVYSVTGLVNPGVNSFTLAIADTSDTAYDSALFFGGLNAGLTTGGGGIENPEVIPLPAGGLLLISGLAAFGFARRRKG